MTTLVSSPATTGVELLGLAKSFGAVHAVDGIDLSVAPGETVALLGPNGAGKSTTIDMLLGLTRPDRGHVTVFGMAPPAAVRAGAIGVMLQTGALIRDLSVRELVTMMASLFSHPLGVEEVLDVARLRDVAERRTQTLSGGETQRARFGVALVSDPDLLVLDEPTVALDVEARHGFWTVMRGFAARGKTVLFATHYLEEADAYADRVVLMSRGHVVADGTPTEIKASVGRRIIRATLPEVDAVALAGLPGVVDAERRGDSVGLRCRDADAALRALLAAYPLAHDIEIRGAGLDAAFLELTAAGVDARHGDLAMSTVVYTRFELLRAFRNVRFFVFSCVFPVVMFFLIAAPNRHEALDSIPFATYYMSGMIGWGSMAAVMAGGARIAAERSVGWHRQLRVTPLSTRAYFGAKVLTGYVMACVTIALLYLSGASLGVHLAASEWVTMTLLILVGLVPFAVLGILLGHLVTVESMGPAMGGLTALFALLGGAWGPITGSGKLHHLAVGLPSYWLVQAGKSAVGGGGWPATAWLVIAVWTVGLGALAVDVYRRDTARA